MRSLGLIDPQTFVWGKLDNFSSFYLLSVFQKGISYWDAPNYAKYLLIFLWVLECLVYFHSLEEA